MASDLPFRYRGYYFDEEINLYYLNTRYYDASIGRFINADDISYLGANGDLQGFNLYAYCSNNPVMGYDHMGQAFLDVLKGFLGNIVSSIEGESSSVNVGIGNYGASAFTSDLENIENSNYGFSLSKGDSANQIDVYVKGSKTKTIKTFNFIDWVDNTWSEVKSWF